MRPSWKAEIAEAVERAFDGGLTSVDVEREVKKIVAKVTEKRRARAAATVYGGRS